MTREAEPNTPPTELMALAAAVAKQAGAMHDKVVETGTLATFPLAKAPEVYIAELASLGVISPAEGVWLTDLSAEVHREGEPDAIDRILAAANSMLVRADLGVVASAIAGIAVASTTRAATSGRNSTASVIGADVLGGLIGGVGGAVAGEMVGGKVGAFLGGALGAVLVGGLASHEAA